MRIINPEVTVICDNPSINQTLVWMGSHKISEVAAWVRDTENKCKDLQRARLITVYTLLPTLNVTASL